MVSGATTLSVCFVGNDVVNAEEETVDMSGSDGDVNVEDAVSAKIKGTDESNDLAVVAVQKSDIPEDTLSQIKIAQLGNSDDLQVGEQVVAIGNALGYGQSVTSGWISALNRNIFKFLDKFIAKSSSRHTYRTLDNLNIFLFRVYICIFIGI